MKFRKKVIIEITNKIFSILCEEKSYSNAELNAISGMVHGMIENMIKETKK